MAATDRTERLETAVAHLLRTAEDLSAVVADQAARIERLERQLGLLLEREADRDAGAGGSVTLADQKPPHW
jgi:SlyX protein